MEVANLIAPRSALFLPASNARAIEKARTLAADMIILDLEDAVKAEDKDRARTMAADAAGGFGNRPVAIRVNGAGTPYFGEDLQAVRTSAATHIVLPKVETPELVARGAAAGKPVLAMIETPAGVLHAGAIAYGGEGLAGLIVGTNDLAAGLKLPPGGSRGAMATALQLIVLAARARGLWVLDGVFNRLDDPDGLAAECREGRAFGFDGKTLIHPNQIDAANRAFSPTEAELEEARALIAAASGGAERFRDRMIEAMHVAAARALLERARTP